MNFKRYFLTCLIIIIPSILMAIDLSQCVSLGIKENAGIKAYENKINSALIMEIYNKKSILPNFSLSIDEGYSIYGDDSGFSNGMTGMAGLNLSWDLQKFLSNYPNISKIETKKMIYQLALEKKTLKRDIEKNYYELYIIYKKKSDYNDAINYFKSHISDIEYLGKKGVNVKLDLERSRVQMASLNISILDIILREKELLKSINSICKSSFTIEDFSFNDIPKVEDYSNLSIDKNSSYSKGSATDLLIKLNNLDLNIAKENYRQNKYFMVPIVSLGFNRAITPIDPAIEKYRTALSLSIPIFDFGQHSEDKKNMKINIEYQNNLNQENDRQLFLSITNTIDQIISASNSFLLLSKNLKSSENSLLIAKDYYKQDQIKETDLLSIFSEYFNVKEQLEDTLWKFLEKKSDLDYLFGE